MDPKTATSNCITGLQRAKKIPAKIHLFCGSMEALAAALYMGFSKEMVLSELTVQEIVFLAMNIPGTGLPTSFI